MNKYLRPYVYICFALVLLYAMPIIANARLTDEDQRALVNSGTAGNPSGALSDSGCPSCNAGGLTGTDTGFGVPSPISATLPSGYSQSSYYRQGSYSQSPSEASYGGTPSACSGPNDPCGLNNDDPTPNNPTPRTPTPQCKNGYVLYQGTCYKESWCEQKTVKHQLFFFSWSTTELVCEKPKDCKLDGVTVKDGKSRKFYKDRNVDYGKTCEFIKRTCDDGDLSGKNKFKYSSCTIDPAPTPKTTPKTTPTPATQTPAQPSSPTPTVKRDCSVNGVTIADGSTRKLYDENLVPDGETCSSINRTCTDGTLSGSSAYTYLSCAVDNPLTMSNISISAVPGLIRYGGEVTVTWDGGNAENCTVKGPGMSVTEVKGEGTVVGITSESTYTLECTLGSTTRSAEATVKVLPTSQET